jgi:predicted DCC family thiol-disulfide oxidoreductase YuxK
MMAPPPGPSLVLFDGHCNLCSGSVNWIIDRDPARRFVFAPLQSDIGRQTLQRFHLDPRRTDSVVLVENDRAHTRSAAALRIARRLKFPWAVLSLLAVIPTPIRDWIYDQIARHRYRWFGRTETCRMPTPELQSRFVRQS